MLKSILMLFCIQTALFAANNQYPPCSPIRSGFEKTVQKLKDSGIPITYYDGNEDLAEDCTAEFIFEVDEVLTIDSARRYMIDIVFSLLDLLVNCYKLTDFTEENIMVTLIGKSTDCKPQDYVITARLFQGWIYYNTEYENSVYVTIYKEPLLLSVTKFDWEECDESSE